jgi:protoheme IX farnesyltransferase
MTAQITQYQRAGALLRALLALTKPRIIELLLISTLPAMVLAQRGLPDLWLVLATLFGGSLSAGSANAFNNVIDADIDRLMGRTSNRPLASGAISQKVAVAFAWSLGTISVLWLWLLVNPLAALLSLVAILFYVFVYTLGLKRRTPQNIVWGGAAGAIPPLIGWAAVTGTLDAAAWVLFLIVFLWTPPHYWPLAMRFRDDYRLAEVPMLPSVASQQVVGRQIVLYALGYVAATILLIPIAGLGAIYAAVAVSTGIWFIAECVRLVSASETAGQPMRVFHTSITQLTLVMVAIALDVLIPLG